MTAAELRSRLEFLILLSGESEVTGEFTVGMEEILNKTQEAVAVAMEAGEFEVVRLQLPILKQMIESQTKFLSELKDKTLIEMWPGEKPPEQETLN